jgi:hypothetical protein
MPPSEGPDEMDYSLGGEGREEWDRTWGAMPHRRLSSPPKIDLETLDRLGNPISFTISLDPTRFHHFRDRVGRASEYCPICGERTFGEDRLAASLNPRWESGLTVTIGVWVHGICFENCPDAGERAPIPW